MAPPVQVFLCDDVSAFRQLMRFALEDDGTIAIVGEAGDGEAGVAGVGETQPDVVLLDISMPKLDGLEAIPLIRDRSPATGVVVLSGFTEERMEQQALRCGADRYLRKGVDLDVIKATVLDVAAERSR
jgi:DNA-binding NarL/FixJ family response regulator